MGCFLMVYCPECGALIEDNAGFVKTVEIKSIPQIMIKRDLN